MLFFCENLEKLKTMSLTYSRESTNNKKFYLTVTCYFEQHWQPLGLSYLQASFAINLKEFKIYLFW